MLERDFTIGNHELTAYYTIERPERDVGYNGGAEIQCVTINYKGRSRPINWSDAINEKITEELDND